MSPRRIAIGGNDISPRADDKLAAVARFQRARAEGEEQRTTAVELFYDLVFVFAVTQVSHLLLHDLSWRGAGRAAVALLVVWWAWNYTTWVTNELDPDSVLVRLLLIGIMLASLLLAIAIPRAFEDRALLFAASYVAIQVGRHLFLTFAAAEAGTIERRRAGRILTWFAAAGALWLAGALAGGPGRPWLWLGALTIDYTAPIVTYRVPFAARIPASAWQVETAHFAERFQLFVIIALGESIVVTGATTAQLDVTAARAAAFAVAFLTTAALWWLYFNYVAVIAQRRLELAERRVEMARDAYTYLHVVLVAGVIVAAVGDEVAIAHPTAGLSAAEIVTAAAGPGIYLLGLAVFRRRVAGTFAPKRVAGAAGCAAAGALGFIVPALALTSLVLAVVVAVIVSEHVAAVRRTARGEPSPLERLEAAETS
jgi:low temperature requirement protein LtrA